MFCGKPFTFCALKSQEDKQFKSPPYNLLQIYVKNMRIIYLEELISYIGERY